MYSRVIWDTQSGQMLAQVEATEGEWQRGRVVEQAHTFSLRSLGFSRVEAHDLFGRDRPRDRVLSVLWDGVPIYHGLIIDSVYTPADGRLTVKHTDVRELMSARWLFGIGGSTVTFDWSGLSWRGMAQRVLRVILTDPISPAWPLPVSGLGSEEAGSESFTTYGFEFRSGESLLTDIEGMPGGPDVDLHPTLSGGLFGWEARVGTPHLSGPTFEYHVQAARSPLVDVAVTTVGAEKVTGVHGIGDGSEWDMIRGGAAAPVSAGLARDTKLTVKNADLATVNARASGFLASRVSTYQQWSFNVRTDAIDLPSLRLGSIIRVESRGDEWIDDGWTEHRVLGFSGSLSTPGTIKLTVEAV